ncbi:MAG: bleomycin resistance protein [Phenylobacterium sp.]|uniref:VOC family protein n=1 Tax=Phenylobacterium sp. TaxID=1871053 RepID=UPI0025D1F1D2|nr:VOC family protein [Phenylobacterium sp.]MBA4010929.1 bleomycin resistance protein [Phenylobacterium sp.]
MTRFRPEGWPTLVPRIFTEDVAGLAAFLEAVFGARSVVRGDAPAEVWIGEGVVLISEGGGRREPTSAFLYVYVEDADLIYQRAMAAGAETLEAPLETAYGDRRATFRDAWGNVWQAATRQA